MLLTDAVFQTEMSWLNAVATWNISNMLLTDAVFQAAMFWLKRVARKNI